MLDIGCGIGDMLAYRADTVGVDVNEHNIDYCVGLGLNAKIMRPDILPFASNEFDSILLDNVIEHIQNPIPLLNEIRRVLDTGGLVLVGVPGFRGWRSDVDHKVEYDEHQLIHCMGQAGFEHSETFYTPFFRSEWLSHNIRQYCLYGLFKKQG